MPDVYVVQQGGEILGVRSSLAGAMDLANQTEGPWKRWSDMGPCGCHALNGWFRLAGPRTYNVVNQPDKAFLPHWQAIEKHSTEG